MSDDMFYARVCAERDQLRAELAAAKDLLARIHRDGGHHTEAAGFTQSVADAGDKVSEWLLVAEERTALAAYVERLELALKQIRGLLPSPDADGLIEDATCTYCDMSSLDGCDGDCPREIAADALAAAEKTRLLAERVMGWSRHKTFPDAYVPNSEGIGLMTQFAANVADWSPLTNLSHAGDVMEAMVRKGYEFDAQDCGVGKYKVWFRGNGKRVHAIAPLLQTAICHVALLAEGVKEEEL